MIYPKKYILSMVAIILILPLFLFKGWNLNYCAEKGDRENNVLVRMDKSKIRPDDGDTFFYKDIIIRILGIDTPEIIHKEHGIFEDQPYGRNAAKMTISLLKNANLVEYLPFKEDYYGRLLAHVFVDEKLLSVHLINAGLAYETVSYFGDNGFPDIAEKILQTAENSPKPAFEKPYKWRRKHQVKK